MEGERWIDGRTGSPDQSWFTPEATTKAVGNARVQNSGSFYLLATVSTVASEDTNACSIQLYDRSL